MVERLAYHAIDSDNHYYEVDDCFSRHIAPRFRDRALHLVVGKQPARRWMMGDRQVSFMPFNALDQTVGPGALQRFFTGEDTKQSLGATDFIRPTEHPAMYQREARLRLMDDQGLEAIVQLPTLGVLVEPDLEDLPDVLTANYESFNRWLEEDWGFGTDGRIFGVPMLTLVDVNWAVAELHRLVERGARFVYLRTGPVAGHSPADPMFDPFWSEVEATGVRPIFHVGNSGFARLFSTKWGEDGELPLVKYSAFQQYTCVVERPIGDTLAALILHNLFGRFPGIEVLSLEHGSSWVGPLLKGMDKAARMAAGMGRTPGGPLTDVPSELFRRHVHVSPFHEDDTIGLVRLIGAERVLFGSDYPHAEGLGDPLDFVDGLSGLDDIAVHQIMRSNAAGLMGLAD